MLRYLVSGLWTLVSPWVFNWPFMPYRFGSYKILIAPVFLVAVGIANTGVLLALNVLSAYDDDGQTRTVLYDKLLLLGCAISIAVNVFLTGAIVLKLWMTGTRTKTRFYLPFILIFVESGAIQTAGILFYVIASLAGNVSDGL